MPNFFDKSRYIGITIVKIGKIIKQPIRVFEF